MTAKRTNAASRMATSATRLWDIIRCRPTRVLWFAPLLLAFDSPGCVMTEKPLTRFQRDAIDDGIIGEWAEDTSPDELALWIGVKGARTMEVRSYDDDGTVLILNGHVSRVGDRTFANLQFVDADCVECSDDRRSEIKAEFLEEYADVLPSNPASTCTWLILPYEHNEGNLHVQFLVAEPVVRAIESGELQGSYASEESADSDEPTCVTSSARRFRRFLVGSESSGVIEDDFAIDYVRRTVHEAPPETPR